MNQDPLLTTTNAPAQNAIALLIDLAQRGEIDPWDVQVIEVIDRCLSELANCSLTQQDTFAADLSQSGQAFLYASMLVLLKADTLGRLEKPEENLDLVPEEISTDTDSKINSQLPMHLERHLQRRPSAGPLQRRPVTLQELIEQLQQVAAALEEKSPRSRIKRPSSQSRAQVARAIATLAHQENLTETATQLEQFLVGHLPTLRPGQDWLVLDQLLELWSANLPSAENHELPELNRKKQNDRVGVFWALLLLSAQSKVELTQEEFYQDIKVRAIQRSCEGMI